MKRTLKIISLSFLVTIVLFTRVVADEGMWLVSLLNEINYKSIKDKGIELELEELFSLDQLSLKDAIVALDGGSCTGTVVSSNGLLLTNHHCGYSEIQEHSSVEHDYLRDGFWAKNYNEELPNPGKSVSFLIDVKDVTDEVNKLKTKQLKNGAKHPNMMRIRRLMAREAVKGTHYNAEVHSVYNGNGYYLFIYETYKDVRLVAAPPSDIGNFGGETDNWEWPRHTADFTFFRVYTAPDGSPAEYSEENVPLKSKKHLKINASGISEGDFSFIMGFPGKTKRYITSYAIDEIINISTPISIEMRNKKLDVMRKAMAESNQIKIKYASKFSGLSNYWKYDMGQRECLIRYNTIDDKRELEKEFQTWANSDNNLNETYGNVLNIIQEAYKNKAKLTQTVKYYNEAVLMGPEIIKFSMRMKRLKKALEDNKLDKNKLEKNIDQLIATYESLYKDYDVHVDKQIFIVLLQHFVNHVDRSTLPEEFTSIAKDYNWDMKQLADDVYSQTIFSDLSKVKSYLKNLTIDSDISDVSINIAYPLMSKAISLNQEESKYEKVIHTANKTFVKGLLEMNPDKLYYPDANSTMRLTYGNVGGYIAKDAVKYNYQTTFEGVIEKNNSDSVIYHIPKKLKSLYQSKDYGDYDASGVLNTCFLTNHDITGGNSGSSVLNAKGEIIGLAFDGNWEAMSGDIAFIPEKQKCINVDIRYVLFIIDKFANAQNIINELTIINK
ncbi:MAG: S46 family peptidase [Bacteroidetes bacterium]|nr:S46 family peptidase [Bacteroidota bacterium]